MDEKELNQARQAMADDLAKHKAGYGCQCGAFWTLTGFGREWHQPDCKRGSSVCQHGQLKRQCPLCEKDDRITELETLNSLALTTAQDTFAENLRLREKFSELETKLDSALYSVPKLTNAIYRRDELLREVAPWVSYRKQFRDNPLWKEIREDPKTGGNDDERRRES